MSAAFSKYTNDSSRGNRISKIQSDQLGFAAAMSQAVEEAYQWKSNRGLEIASTAILAIEYDEDTKELLKDFKKADALSGARGNSFMQQSVARGIQAAGENPNGGGASMAFMGMGMNAAGGMAQGVVQSANANQNPFINVNGAQQQTQPQQSVQSASDPYEELKKAKELLDAGVISQEDFDAKKKSLLGI